MIGTLVPIGSDRVRLTRRFAQRPKSFGDFFPVVEKNPKGSRAIRVFQAIEIGPIGPTLASGTIGP